MTLFEEDQLSGKYFKVLSKPSLGGQLAAIWIEGNGQPFSQFIWNALIAKTFSNMAEINTIIDLEFNSRVEKGELVNRSDVCRDIIIRSGLFEVSKAQSQKSNDGEEPTIDPETLKQLAKKAKTLGKTPSELIRELLKQTDV